MKAVVDAKAFYDAMKKVSGALHRSAIPSLEQICVDFESGVCRMTASDLTLWLSVEIPAEGDSFSFMFSNTENAVRACRYFSGEMTAELRGEKKDKKVLLVAEGKSGEFPAEDVDMCPACPTEEAQYRYMLDAPLLLERIKRVKYAALISSEKPALAGVRFEGKHVWCVDGHRLAVSDDDSLNVERPFILPSNALAHLKVFDAGETELAVGQRYAVFTAAGTKLLVRQLVPSDYLRIENTVPQESKENYPVDRRKLLDAIQYLDGCSRGMRNPFVIFDGRRLILKNGGSEYSAELEVNGEIQYAFHLKYMKEALEQFAGEDVIRICVSSRTAPIVLRAGSENTALMLPVRMKEDWRWNAA